MKYVLGGGIAGLIYGFYNKDFIIISPEFGGQMAAEFAIGPRYLHDTPESRKLLQDLGLPIEVFVVKVGYFYNGWHTNTPSKDFREQYYMHSRGTMDGFDSTSMNSGKQSFNALRVDFKKMIELLVQELEEQDRLVKGKVEKIDIDKSQMHLDGGHGNPTIDYNELVSTMPLNIFCKLANIPFDAQTIQTTYVLVPAKDLDMAVHEDFVYVVDKRKPFHRVTFDKFRELAVCDCLGWLDEDEVQRRFPTHIKFMPMANTQIIPIAAPPELPNVKFIGRYGTWSRGWKTEKVIKVAQEDGFRK
jgi:hypothetical protein